MKSKSVCTWSQTSQLRSEQHNAIQSALFFNSINCQAYLWDWPFRRTIFISNLWIFNGSSFVAHTTYHTYIHKFTINKMHAFRGTCRASLAPNIHRRGVHKDVFTDFCYVHECNICGKLYESIHSKSSQSYLSACVISRQ